MKFNRFISAVWDRCCLGTECGTVSFSSQENENRTFICFRGEVIHRNYGIYRFSGHNLIHDPVLIQFGLLKCKQKGI